MTNPVKTKRILIVEDSLEWQKVHITLLHAYSRIPLNVEIASNAREGLMYIEENLKTPFDLILTDLQMETDFHPQFAGEWLVKQIKQIKEYQNVPIVIISATYNIDFIASSLGVDSLSKRSLINNSNNYNLMLDEQLL
ncbi:MAG: response regulator [Clostridium sp.]|nr:response regulator [Clostridium sp.]